MRFLNRTWSPKYANVYIWCHEFCSSVHFHRGAGVLNGRKFGSAGLQMWIPLFHFSISGKNVQKLIWKLLDIILSHKLPTLQIELIVSTFLLFYRGVKRWTKWIMWLKAPNDHFGHLPRVKWKDCQLNPSRYGTNLSSGDKILTKLIYFRNKPSQVEVRS